MFIYVLFLVRHGVLEQLVKILNLSNGAAQTKALFGASCLIRGNCNGAQEIFVEQLDGLDLKSRYSLCHCN